jgi:hypothetical protein
MREAKELKVGRVKQQKKKEFLLKEMNVTNISPCGNLFINVNTILEMDCDGLETLEEWFGMNGKRG